MPVFDTIKNLQSYIQGVTIPQIADVVETELKSGLNEEVEDKVYKDAFVADDEFYKHTFGLKDSAMSEMMRIGNNNVGKGILIDIYLDPKSSYYSYYPIGGERNVTDMIVSLLNDGHGGFYKGRKIDYKPRGFFESTYKNLIKSGKLKKTIISNLKRLGYQLSR